jgi:hypothetical protein
MAYAGDDLTTIIARKFAVEALPANTLFASVSNADSYRIRK